MKIYKSPLRLPVGHWFQSCNSVRTITPSLIFQPYPSRRTLFWGRLQVPVSLGAENRRQHSCSSQCLQPTQCCPEEINEDIPSEQLDQVFTKQKWLSLKKKLENYLGSRKWWIMDDRAKKEDNCFPSRQYSLNEHNFKGSTATCYGIPKEEEMNYTTSQQRNGQSWFESTCRHVDFLSRSPTHG